MNTPDGVTTVCAFSQFNYRVRSNSQDGSGGGGAGGSVVIVAKGGKCDVGNNRMNAVHQL